MRWDLAGYSSHPIDGDATRVQECASHLADVARGIRDQISTFDGLGSPEVWDTPAAPGFRNVVEDLPTKLDLVATRYEKAAAALDDFHPTLASTRSDAEYWIGQAETAQAEIERAQGGIETMEDHGEQAEQNAQTYNDAHPDEPDREPEPWAGENYHATLSSAQGDLDTAVGNVQNAVESFNTSAGTAAGAIRDASDDDLKNEGGLFGAIKRGAKWLVENTPIGEITKILDTIAGVLGVLALALSWVPIVGQVLAVAALVVGIAALLGHLVLFAAGEETGWDVALAALGVVGGGLGRIAGRAVQFGGRGARLAARVSGGRVLTTARGARVTQLPVLARTGRFRLGIRSHVAVRSGSGRFGQALPRGTQVHVGPGGAPPRILGNAPDPKPLYRHNRNFRNPAGTAPVSASPAQQRIATETTSRLQRAGARDIRVDQHQVTDVAGRGDVRVGANRPDVQGTVGNQRVNFEYDPPGGNRVAGHVNDILTHDPDSIAVTVPVR